MKHAIALLVCLLAISPAFAGDKPNIVFIVADDMGYGDPGVQGGKDIPTPNIDAIAAAGVRFTNGYVSGSVCSPSRAALMTGRYQQRDGVTDWVRPGASHALNPGVPTIADYLKRAGYHSMLVGKWHLGEPEECNPLNRGFDEFFGFLGGGRTYWIKGSEEKTKPYQQIVRQREPIDETEYTTFAFGREAVSFIERRKGQDKPFFLYLAFNAVHQPMEAPKDYIDRFSSIGDGKRRTYAGMLSATDVMIGKVLAALHDTGAEQNTLVCFISDNGGPITHNAPNASTNTPLRGGKGETWEGGIRVPFIMKWPGHIKPGATDDTVVIQMDFVATALNIVGEKPDAKWPIDGVDLMPHLTANAPLPDRMLYWYCPTNGQQWAIRDGNWKLANAIAPKGKPEPTLGLYDLSKDIHEDNDLSAAHPDIVARLKAAYEKWHAETGSDVTAQHSDANAAP
ncbi:MAG: sulfatase-like hydrolase/transferase [Phycisphaera sp.]|nr:sulfatase-like hydrolase/transferase [Phycisphaera sp.]